MIEEEAVKKLGELARIPLSDSEAKMLARDIESILEYVGEVDKVRKEKAEPQPGAVYNVLREDTTPHESGVYTENLLKEAPDAQDGYIKVKKIL